MICNYSEYIHLYHFALHRKGVGLVTTGGPTFTAVMASSLIDSFSPSLSSHFSSTEFPPSASYLSTITSSLLLKVDNLIWLLSSHPLSSVP